MSAPTLLTPAQRAAAEAGLAFAEQQMARHMEAVGLRFGPVALGVVDLPPLGGGRLVDAQVRVGGVLYWAAELEAAGLLPFVEALAEGVATGAVLEPLGAAVHDLVRLWRERQQRLAGAERRALFVRLLGDSQAAARGEAVEPLLAGLVDTLRAIGRAAPTAGTGGLQARAVVQAQALGAMLSARGVGMAAFAARDVVGQVRNALNLLRGADVARALGGGGPWMIVARHAPRFLGRAVNPQRHLDRARAGMRIVGWIADEAARLDGGAVQIPREAPVIRDAEGWAAASGVA
jgi:hypothetical protein